MVLLQTREVNQDHWLDFEALFECKGSPHFCYCMVWRAVGEERRMKGPLRKAAMKQRVDAGTPVGLIGYAEGAPVAWCSVAPRSTYRRLGGLEMVDEAPEDVWSIACFFVKRQWRPRLYPAAHSGGNLPCAGEECQSVGSLSRITRCA